MRNELQKSSRIREEVSNKDLKFKFPNLAIWHTYRLFLESIRETNWQIRIIFSYETIT